MSVLSIEGDMEGIEAGGDHVKRTSPKSRRRTVGASRTMMKGKEPNKVVKVSGHERQGEKLDYYHYYIPEKQSL